MQISKRNIFIICIGIMSILISILVFTQTYSDSVPQLREEITKQIITEGISVKEDKITCSDSEVKLFFEDFIKKFNTNKASELNAFIDKNIGVAIFLRDGYYPILSFSDKIDDWISWFDFKIYDTLEFEKFPEYLGDGEFEKTGFFYVKYKNKFSLDDFDDSYSNRSDEEKKPFRQLEKICNYRADVMSLDNSSVLTLYFSIYKNKKKLVGITQDSVDDILYINQEKEFVPIDTEEQVEQFLLNNRRFCDLDNNGYVDFDKKELTYCDFGDEPFLFSNYKIGKIEVISKKIKIREITFYNSDKDDSFTLKLSNKGAFSSYRMGARPQYIYEKCK